MYNAVIAPLVNIRSHPGADRLQLATVSGFQVIVGLDAVEGTMGIFFPDGGQISKSMCKENNLYRHTELNKDPDAKSGFFEDNRRVRAQRFRGQISEGYWTELDNLAWTGYNLAKLKPGTAVIELGTELVCRKYYTPQMQRLTSANARARRKLKRATENCFPTFLQHFDTKKLRMFISNIPSGSVIHISEKAHGTSARTGYLKRTLPLGKFKKLWNKLPWGAKFPTYKWDYINGTRRVVLDPDADNWDHAYAGAERYFINKTHFEGRLRQGETVYYEIVGFMGESQPISQVYKVENKIVKEAFGEQMTFSYGCCKGNIGLMRILIYRITNTTPDGHTIELSWPQVQARCLQLGLETVPHFKTFIYNGDTEDLATMCRDLADGPSTLDASHIKEGVCVRVEHPEHFNVYKFKSFEFCEIEGIKNNDSMFIDHEELS